MEWLCRGEAGLALWLKTPLRRVYRSPILAMALLLAACAPQPTPPPPPDALIVGQAQTTDGPVLWAQGSSVVSAWVGSDTNEVFQVARRDDAEPVVLPLPPRHPFAQQGYTAANDHLHLLWLDAGESGANQLYTALLTPDLRVERGPTAVSDVFTQRYAASPAADSSLFVAWSGGLPAEPALYTQRIDAEGRPLTAQRVALNADWPALANADAAPTLYWLDRESGDLWRAAFDGTGAARVASGVRLAPGDRIVGVSAASHGESHFFAWNVTRADGSDESWLTSGQRGAIGWPAPMQLFVEVDGEAQPVRWLAFAQGTDSTIAAAQVGQQVGFVAMEALQVTRFEAVAPLTADLIGPPRWLALADGRRALSWAEPGAESAALKVAFTQP